MLAGCQKENSDRLVLVAEGMGGNQKMYVNGTESYWMDGDQVNINGTVYNVSVSGSTASISGDFNSGTTYYGVFPASAFHSRNGNDVEVIMPDTYHYKVDGSGRQVVDAPMAAYGTPSSGKLYFKHLTGAMNVIIDATIGFSLDSIIVISGGGTDPCVALQQIFHVDMSNIDDFDGGSTTLGGDAVIYGRVAMVFDQTEMNWTASEERTVQVPVPPTAVNTKYTIRVVGHYNGTKHVFERKQTSDTRVVRAKIGNVPVNIRSNASEGYTTTSALFETETVAGTDYFKIANAIDFKLMNQAIKNSWSYGNPAIAYSASNYLLKNNIDMSGVELYVMNDMNGSIIDGGNHTVSNVVVLPTQFYVNNQGLLYSPQNVTLRNITFDNLTISRGESTMIDNFALCNNIGENTSLTIDHVNIFGYRIQQSRSGNTDIGGFVGTIGNGSQVSISNSSLTFAEGQSFSSSNGFVDSKVGGIANSIGNGTLTLNTVTVDFNSLTYNCGSRSLIFGGAVYSKSSSGSVSFQSTTISGNVYLNSNNSTITARRVIGSDGSQENSAYNGVTTTLLSIYVNGVLQQNNQ